jgi:plastocyanin
MLTFPVRRLLLYLVLTLSLRAHADITGTVTLSGPPQSQDETFVAKANGCGESPIRRTENWKIGPKGELGDVVVWVVDPKSGKPLSVPAFLATVAQIGCRYEPHVVAVRAEAPLEIVNADPTLHNIRATVYTGPGQPPGDTVFNFGQGRQGERDQRTFDTPGIYTLQCDVHAWMQCWVMVLPKAPLPYCGVTDKTGAFAILGGGALDDGDYKMDAWHPRFADKLEQTVHVKNGSAVVNFTFNGAKSF